MLWSHRGGRMWKVSFGGRTVYNLAWKQSCPSELHGNGTALLLQTFLLSVFLFHSLSKLISLLFSWLALETMLNQTPHSSRGPSSSVYLVGHTGGILSMLQKGLRLRTAKALKIVRKGIIYEYFGQHYSSSVHNFSTRENLNIQKSINQLSTWRLKQQDLLSRELPEIFLSIFHVCVPYPSVPQQEI